MLGQDRHNDAISTVALKPDPFRSDILSPGFKVCECFQSLRVHGVNLNMDPRFCATFQRGAEKMNRSEK